MTNIFDSIRISKTGRATPGPRTGVCYKKRQGGKGHAPAQDEVVAFVAKCLADTGEAPTMLEIQAHMGWKQKHSVIDVLRKVAGRLPTKAKHLVQW